MKDENLRAMYAKKNGGSGVSSKLIKDNPIIRKNTKKQSEMEIGLKNSFKTTFVTKGDGEVNGSRIPLWKLERNIILRWVRDFSSITDGFRIENANEMQKLWGIHWANINELERDGFVRVVHPLSKSGRKSKWNVIIYPTDKSPLGFNYQTKEQILDSEFRN
jgi:hypothetical protein